jgi:hypothetical protein
MAFRLCWRPGELALFNTSYLFQYCWYLFVSFCLIPGDRNNRRWSTIDFPLFNVWIEISTYWSTSDFPLFSFDQQLIFLCLMIPGFNSAFFEHLVSAYSYWQLTNVSSLEFWKKAYWRITISADIFILEFIVWDHFWFCLRPINYVCSQLSPDSGLFWAKCQTSRWFLSSQINVAISDLIQNFVMSILQHQSHEFWF